MPELYIITGSNGAGKSTVEQLLTPIHHKLILALICLGEGS